MRWTSIIGTLLALASLGLVARVALRTSTPDPQALHAAAEAQLALGAEGDLSLMAVQVDRLLASPSLSLDPEEEQVLALDSARPYRALGSRQLALERYQRRRLSLGAATPEAILEEAGLLLGSNASRRLGSWRTGVAGSPLPERPSPSAGRSSRPRPRPPTTRRRRSSIPSSPVRVPAAPRRLPRAVARALSDASRNYWVGEPRGDLRGCP